MTTSKRREEMLRALCAQPEVDDGQPFEPRKDHSAGRAHDRKSAQLCKQAMRVASLVLQHEVSDPLLRGLEVVRVEPGASPGHLEISVSPQRGAEELDVHAVNARLRGVAPYVRAQLAAAIKRKRVPSLSFVIVPRDAAEEVSDEE